MVSNSKGQRMRSKVVMLLVLVLVGKSPLSQSKSVEPR